jgi:hypothetical protein
MIPDSKLQWRICSSKGVDGMRSNFEGTVVHILLYCPVAKKRITGSKRGPGKISDMTGEKTEGSNVSSFGVKSGQGATTGVHLHYHKHSQYVKLSKAEQSELREWRSSAAGKASTKGDKDKSKKKVGFTDKSISAVVDKKIDAKLKAAQNDHSQQGEAEAFITSCLQKFATGELVALKTAKAATSSSVKATSKTILNSILGRAKNSSKDN